jgi:HAE1 family hydrophobic/amphiphilic exporter-1
LWGRLNLGFENFLTNLQNTYGRILLKVLSHKRYVFLGVLALLIGAIALVPAGFIGAAFMPASDQGEFTVQIELAPTASIYESNKVTQQAEQMLLKHPEVTNVFSNIGYSSNNLTSSSNSNLSTLNVKLIDKKERAVSTEDFSTIVKREVAKIPGTKVTVSPTGLVGTSEAPIQIAVKGTNLDSIRKASAMILKITESVPGTQDVKYSVQDPKPEVKVNLNRERMAQLGINAA